MLMDIHDLRKSFHEAEQRRDALAKEMARANEQDRKARMQTYVLRLMVLNLVLTAANIFCLALIFMRILK